jgi:Domain of unknown function (DUF5666)
MNFGSTCSSRYSAFSFLTWTFCIVLGSNFMTGCAGGGSGTGPTLSGNTSVTLLASSTANDQLSGLTLNITGITLTNKAGKPVTLLDTQQNVEFMHLNGGVEPVTTVSIPQDVYTSATVNYDSDDLICAGRNAAANENNYNSSISMSAGESVNLPSPITVTGTAMALTLDLQISKASNFDCTDTAVVNSVAGTFNMIPVTIADSPTNSTNGKATGLRGSIGSVAANGAGFSVNGADGPIGQVSLAGPLWQVSTASNTVFQGISGASQLAAGLPVDMDVAIQADGSLLATRVEVYDINPSNLSFSIGPQVSVAASVSLMTPLSIERQGPAFLGISDSGDVFNFGSAAFQTSGQMANVSALPFTASFDATNMVPGQSIFITTHGTEDTTPYQSTTVTLLPQTINGTVSAVSSSGSFTTYTVSVAAYDLFPDFAVQPGQATLLTNPGSILVYVDSNTQQLNSDPLTVGSVLRFNGLVFNDNGILRMDCAQINDGVPE